MNIILGGTHGLGLEITNYLQSEGKLTFVIGRTYDEARHGMGMQADVSSRDDIKRIQDSIESHDIDGFFWVAGYGYVGDFSEQEDSLKMSEVNFSNIIPIAQVAWRKLLKRDNSKFVVISSTTGSKARSNEAVYAATKHAQVGFARSLGLESERLMSPIKVSLFLPGGMQTPFWDGSRPDVFDSFLDPVKVASEVITDINNQTTPYYERTIDRGSL